MGSTQQKDSAATAHLPVLCPCLPQRVRPMRGRRCEPAVDCALVDRPFRIVLRGGVYSELYWSSDWQSFGWQLWAAVTNLQLASESVWRGAAQRQVKEIFTAPPIMMIHDDQLVSLPPTLTPADSPADSIH